MLILTLKAGDKMSRNKNKAQNSPEICAHDIKANMINEVDIHYFETIDSTNNEAKKHNNLLTDTPMLFVANQQYGGRGRLGRSFYSPKDTGLYMSLMLKRSDNSEDIVCMTTAVAVCVCDAIKALCDIEPKIKWVNDIYVENKKVCGILCEAVTNPDTSKIDAIIICIGINISTSNFPDDIKDIATSLKSNLDKSKLCALITDNILAMQKNISQRSFIEKYKSYSLVLNKEITYTQSGITKTAIAVDIDKNGALVVRTTNGYDTLSTGEITVRLHQND